MCLAWINVVWPHEILTEIINQQGWDALHLRFRIHGERGFIEGTIGDLLGNYWGLLAKIAILSGIFFYLDVHPTNRIRGLWSIFNPYVIPYIIGNISLIEQGVQHISHLLRGMHPQVDSWGLMGGYWEVGGIYWGLMFFFLVRDLLGDYRGFCKIAIYYLSYPVIWGLLINLQLQKATASCDVWTWGILHGEW